MSAVLDVRWELKLRGETVDSTGEEGSTAECKGCWLRSNPLERGIEWRGRGGWKEQPEATGGRGGTVSVSINDSPE
jgi:hypothetical protein